MRPVRTLAIAALAVTLGVPSAFAQDAFPDTPSNHWAFAALARMKQDGLLVGYPDGLFRGGRPASRYELAVAMHAVYTALKNSTDGLEAQLKALTDRVNGVGNGSSDIDSLRDAVATLRAEVDRIKSYGADIADLRRASDTFEKELTQLGVDVQAMKDDLKSLSGRVSALEKKKAPVEVSGEIDLWAGGGHGLTGRYGLTKDGRLTGVSDKTAAAGVFPPVANLVGITDDLAILHEAAFTLKSTNDKGPKWHATGVISNMFGQNIAGGVPQDHIGFGNQSDLFSPANGAAGAPGLFGYSEGTGDLYLQDAVVSWSGRWGSVDAGRVRFKGSPWLFQRIDNTLYFDNDRWDDGRYTFDGAIVNLGIGSAKLNVFGGTPTSVQTVNKVELNPLRTGPADGLFGGEGASRLDADRTVGVTLTGSYKGLNLRGDLLRLEADQEVIGANATYDALDGFGVEGGVHLGRFALDAGYHGTQLRNDDSVINGFGGHAWNADLGWASGPLDLGVTYREVGLNYLAPGDWGRLGILRNPTNIRGVLGHGGWKFGRGWGVSAEGELSHGLRDEDSAGSFFDGDTKIERYSVRLDGPIKSGFGWYVSYENTLFRDLAGAGVTSSPRYEWYGLGLKGPISGNAQFSLAYEQSAIKQDFVTSGGFVGNDFRGGFLTTQISVKF